MKGEPGDVWQDHEHPSSYLLLHPAGEALWEVLVLEPRRWESPGEIRLLSDSWLDSCAERLARAA